MACMTGDRFTLDGGGASTRSFIHIQDVCTATLELARSTKPGDTFHISNDSFITIQLVERLSKKLEKALTRLLVLDQSGKAKTELIC